MDLYLRFFVREEGEKEEMIATKIYLDYSDDFKYLIDRESLPNESGGMFFGE